MKSCYPEGFPDFNGDVIYSQKYWDEFENWLEEERGIVLKEHINDRPADIESDQKLYGTDNAVVDCKKYTLVAHSEDEKPVDCKLEKPALEKPVAGDKVDVKLYEVSDNRSHWSDALVEDLVSEVPWFGQQGENGEPEYLGFAKSQDDMLDKMVKDRRSDYIYENTYIDELDEETYKYMREQGDLSDDEIKELDNYFGLEESLVEAKKDDEEELPPDPGAVKVEVHGMLNDLVADEIEAINGYEDVKAELVDEPIEHKDEIIATLDHIKDEEKEHIDELVDAASEIPFEGEPKSFDERKEEINPTDVIPEEEQAALASGEVVEEPAVEEVPDEPELESLEEDADVDYVEYMHSYCNALEPHMDELRKIDNVEELKQAILSIINSDPDVNTTHKKNKFAYLIQNKKWASTANLMKYLEMAMNKAKTIQVKVDDNGELVKESYRFSPEEQDEYNCDEDGYYEENGHWGRLVKCGWCEEFFDEEECKYEADFGWLCDRCQDELSNHGGPLTFIEPGPQSCDDEDELEAKLHSEKKDESLTEAVSFGIDSIYEKYEDAVTNHFFELKDQENEEEADAWYENWYDLKDVKRTDHGFELTLDKPLPEANEDQEDGLQVLAYAFGANMLNATDEHWSEGGIVTTPNENVIYVEDWVLEELL